MFKDNNAFSSFSVKDIAEAKKFYTETLGLSFEEPMGMLQLHLAGGGRVFVYPKPNHTPATFTVLNIEVANIEKAVDELLSKEIKFEHYDEEYMKTDERGISRMPDGPSMAWFKDPAGNILSVIEKPKS